MHSLSKSYEDRGYTSEAMSSAVAQIIHRDESTVHLTQRPASIPSTKASAQAVTEWQIPERLAY